MKMILRYVPVGSRTRMDANVEESVSASSVYGAGLRLLVEQYAICPSLRVRTPVRW